MMDYKKYRDSNGDIHWHITGEIGEDWVEIQENEIPLPDPNYVMPYDVQRMNSYPAITNQLDMLWHELNTTGTISTEGTWFNTVKEVKDNNPKPSN